MTRVVSLVLAVGAGLCAGLFLALTPHAEYAGHTASCTAPLVGFEIDEGAGPESPPAVRAGEPGYVEYQLARACDREERRWLVYAGLAALACAGAGSVARFSGRREEDQQVKNATA